MPKSRKCHSELYYHNANANNRIKGEKADKKLCRSKGTFTSISRRHLVSSPAPLHDVWLICAHSFAPTLPNGHRNHLLWFLLCAIRCESLQIIRKFTYTILIVSRHTQHVLSHFPHLWTLANGRRLPFGLTIWPLMESGFFQLII